MKFQVKRVSDVGVALRAIRSADKLRIDHMAEMIGISKQFATDLENGKETIQLGKVLYALQQMGIVITLDVPDRAADTLQRLAKERESGDWRHKKRGTSPGEPSGKKA